MLADKDASKDECAHRVVYRLERSQRYWDRAGILAKGLLGNRNIRSLF